MCFNVSASDTQFVYEFEDVTVIFAADTLLDESGREKVANYLVYGDSNASTYGLWCTLWGHSYETHSAETITHCVYDTNPRCQRDIYQVQVCTRCEHTVSELVATTFITCCPEE